MKRSWLRLLLSGMIIAAALIGAASRGVVILSAPACAEMGSMDEYPDSHPDHATIPKHCDSLVCSVIHLSPTSSEASCFTALADRLPHPRDDAKRRGLAGPPDLRPPIS